MNHSARIKRPKKQRKTNTTLDQPTVSKLTPSSQITKTENLNNMKTNETTNDKDNTQTLDSDSVQRVVSPRPIVLGITPKTKRQEGIQASRRGELPIHCPYYYGSKDRENWVNGWRKHKESTGVILD